jgi:thiamine-monophosphate kinase
MDISDGLTLDAARMANASGCGIVLDLAKIPISNDAERLASMDENQSALEHALTDGEDFELLLAVPPAAADGLLGDQPLEVPLTRIGECIEKAGLWQRGADGSLTAITPRGYEH